MCHLVGTFDLIKVFVHPIMAYRVKSMIFRRLHFHPRPHPQSEHNLNDWAIIFCFEGGVYSREGGGGRLLNIPFFNMGVYSRGAFI